MLLTLPWVVAVYFGRVNIDNGVPRYKPPPGSQLMRDIKDDFVKLDESHMSTMQMLTGTGVGIGDEIRENAVLMLKTLIGYFVVQIPALFWVIPKKGIGPEQLVRDQTQEGAAEKWLAMLGLVVCAAEFFAYL